MKALRQRIGCGLNPARDQVRALRAAGMSIEEIHRAIDLHGRPGLAPWTWTARVTGTRNDPRGGMSAAEILAYGRQDNGSPAKENP